MKCELWDRAGLPERVLELPPHPQEIHVNKYNDRAIAISVAITEAIPPDRTDQPFTPRIFRYVGEINDVSIYRETT